MNEQEMNDLLDAASGADDNKLRELAARYVAPWQGHPGQHSRRRRRHGPCQAEGRLAGGRLDRDGARGLEAEAHQRRPRQPVEVEAAVEGEASVRLERRAEGTEHRLGAVAEALVPLRRRRIGEERVGVYAAAGRLLSMVALAAAIGCAPQEGQTAAMVIGFVFTLLWTACAGTPCNDNSACASGVCMADKGVCK